MDEKVIGPLVSTAWLAENLNSPGLVILDIRGEPDYLTGHIPGAVNGSMPNWIASRNGLMLELPENDALFKVIGNAGIKKDSDVVIVNITGHPFPLADAARIADTLIYAGVPGVSILNGGYTLWEKECRPVSSQNVVTEPVEYTGEVLASTFVSMDYVRSRLGKAVIIDARDPEVYFGIVQEASARRPGHIPGAKCLPAPWIWDKEGLYRDQAELAAMAAGAAGKPAAQEIIVYCGVGGYAGAWWFLLTRMLGYTNVKFYDGSAEEWTRESASPLVCYRWE